MGLPVYPVSKKTVELIIYCASHLKDKPAYGATLLGKSLYLCDCMSYLERGYPISEFKYIKQDFGPTPDPSKYLPIRDMLVQNGELEIIKSYYYNTVQKKPIAKRKPDVKVFDKEEIVIINDVLNDIADQSATSISNFTHELMGWQFAEKNEEIPFHAFLLTSVQPSEKDRKASLKAIKKYLDSKETT